MTDQRAQAGHEPICGELRIEAAELQVVSREATAAHRMFIAVQCCVVGLAVVAAVMNVFEGQALLKAFGIPSMLLALSLSSIATQKTSRRERIAAILQVDPAGSAVNYQLGTSGIEIQRPAGSRRLTWTECTGFRESAHAFVLFVGRAVPEVVYKRAFREDQLPVIRKWLGGNIKSQARTEAFAIALVLGILIVAAGVAVAVATHSAHH